MAFGYKTRRQYKLETEELRAVVSDLVRERDIDSLTGVGSGKKLYRELAQAIKEGIQWDNNVCVIFGDMDDLHGLNRRTSQEFVDKEIFPRIANRLIEVVSGVRHRETDLFRRSGDEFIIIVKNAGPESAKLIAQRAVTAVAGDHELQEHGVGISMGVADIWEFLKDPKTRHIAAEEESLSRHMLDRAEANMKAAKEAKKAALGIVRA